MLNDLRTAVAAGTAYFGLKRDESAGALCLGDYVTTRDAGECVAIFPSVAKILTNSASLDVVRTGLRKVAAFHTGSITRVCTIKGQSVRMICIPKNLWEGAPIDESDEPTAPVLALAPLAPAAAPVAPVVVAPAVAASVVAAPVVRLAPRGRLIGEYMEPYAYPEGDDSEF
jgi:hypothetical protein